MPLIEESHARNPAQPGTYRIGTFSYHYAHGRYEEALAATRGVGAPNVVYGLIVPMLGRPISESPEHGDCRPH